jgi:hypothetical protein
LPPCIGFETAARRLSTSFRGWKPSFRSKRPFSVNETDLDEVIRSEARRNRTSEEERGNCGQICLVSVSRAGLLAVPWKGLKSVSHFWADDVGVVRKPFAAMQHALLPAVCSTRTPLGCILLACLQNALFMLARMPVWSQRPFRRGSLGCIASSDFGSSLAGRWTLQFVMKADERIRRRYGARAWEIGQDRGSARSLKVRTLILAFPIAAVPRGRIGARGAFCSRQRVHVRVRRRSCQR